MGSTPTRRIFDPALLCARAYAQVYKVSSVMATDENPLERIDRWIGNAESKKTALAEQIDELDSKRRELKEKVDSIQKLVDTLRSARQSMSELDIDPTLIESELQAPGETHFERVANFFRLRQNALASTSEIESGTGIPRSSLTAVLYRTHEDKFERFITKDSRLQRWRLRDYIPPPPAPEPVSDSGDDIPF